MTKDEWKETSEFWRSAAVAWQTWADELLSKRELQPTGGVHGAVGAREIITELCDRVEAAEVAYRVGYQDGVEGNACDPDQTRRMEDTCNTK